MLKKELKDIVMGSPNRNKKMILATATLSVILIIAIMILNSLNSMNTIRFKDAYIPQKNYAIKQGPVTFYVDSYKINDNECVEFEDATLCNPVQITKLRGN